MSTNPDAIRAGAGYPGGILVGPVGTAMPATPTATPDAAFLDVGELEESGIIFPSPDLNINNVINRQGQTVRSFKSGLNRTFTFTALETNQTVLGLYIPDTTFVTATGVTTITPGDGTQPDVRAWIIDFLDGDIHTRRLIPRGEVTGFSDVSYVDSDAVKYQFTVTCYADSTGKPWTDLTDDPNVAESS